MAQTGDFRTAIQSWFRGQIDELTDGVKNVAKDSAQEIENITKYHIETRGTVKSGKRGRIETGAMRDAVTSGVVSQDANHITTRAGYEDAPYYTAFQEPGTQWIEPLYALTDAAEEVLTNLGDDMERVIRGV